MRKPGGNIRSAWARRDAGVAGTRQGRAALAVTPFGSPEKGAIRRAAETGSEQAWQPGGATAEVRFPGQDVMAGGGSAPVEGQRTAGVASACAAIGAGRFRADRDSDPEYGVRPTRKAQALVALGLFKCGSGGRI